MPKRVGRAAPAHAVPVRNQLLGAGGRCSAQPLRAAAPRDHPHRTSVSPISAVSGGDADVARERQLEARRRNAAPLIAAITGRGKRGGRRSSAD
jgi:hypothetical protein